MIKRILIALLFSLAFGVEAYATHIRAGEITAVRISQSSLRYRFTLIIFRDTESGVEVGDGGLLNFGQGRILEGREALEGASVEGRFNEQFIGNQTSVVTIQWEHTFDGPGVFVVSYTEQNRNANIINLGGADSESLPFHIETVIRIDPGFDVNGTPQLTIPPIDRACVGQRFIHNAGAFDPDGDSLAYKLVVPMQGRGAEVTTYIPLDDTSITTISQDGSGVTEFSIDPLTGDVVWDAPQFEGEYNLAFIIEEWRFSEFTGRFELLGYVTRDMQVIVEDCDNERPELEVPPDTCVVAGTLLQEEIIGKDPDGNRVLVEAFGGTFEQNISPSRFLNLPDSSETAVLRPQPASYLFEWQTNIAHVQRLPHQVRFKIRDEPFDPNEPSLNDFKTWNVTVVAPAPDGLTASVATGRSIQLNWDDYIGANFNPTMQVYRRIESFDFDPTGCNIGIPANSGYELIKELPIDQTDLLDDQDLRPGVEYCYRLVAEFPNPKGGTSYASTEVCVTIPLDVPAITHVSIKETDDTNGEVFVRWTSPLEIDENLFPPPYTYELVRYNSFNSTAGRTELITTQDTIFTDTGLNTANEVFNYQVRFFDSANNLIDSSATASSLRLEAQGGVKSVNLSWSADVPWSNQVQSSPYHLIYRDRTDANADDVGNLVLIDSVKVTEDGLTYLDDGRFNNVALLEDREYCYFVTARGSYGNDKIPSPLVNDSQIICLRPNDDTPPEQPEIEIPEGDTTTVIGPDGETLLVLENEICSRLEFEPCNFSDFSNTINWSRSTVDNDVDGFNVYFSETGASTDYEFIAFTRRTTFTHENLNSLKGCYKISAVDRSGNEGEQSQAICFDNCPNYELPNTFTPNGDGFNDTFRAFDQPNDQCPRFVESVTFKVFDRWGGNELFTFETQGTPEPNFFIDWDGRDKNGVDLASGTYYYTATVTFDVLNPALRTKEFRNWVKIIR